MPPLRHVKNERFAQCIASGMSGTAAVKKAFPESKTWKKTSISPRASALRKREDIRARIAELQAPTVEKIGLTLEAHLAKLEELRDLAVARRNYSAAIAAEVKRGEVSKLYVQMHEMKMDGEIKYVSNIPEPDPLAE